MKKTPFPETQIVKAIQEHEGGNKVEDMCRELAISTAAFYKWRQRYGGMEVAKLKRLKELKKRIAGSSACMLTFPLYTKPSKMP